eukprot:CAMPEP_0172814300 /NCGR_PEP_ID=MMETSP1075-20121228/11162_1 /TAXON_ID=2916 /ORGANISM="Ceratium fusus, Strain PA161109" /LENGTH=563 /DNA_ID=CAMNT_0013654089 /DNA_START=18 /DNA_END=1709 /DNA_ORIENTATION=-
MHSLRGFRLWPFLYLELFKIFGMSNEGCRSTVAQAEHCLLEVRTSRGHKGLQLSKASEQDKSRSENHAVQGLQGTAALAQIDRRSHVADRRSESKQDKAHPAEWFGGFSDSESTYNPYHEEESKSLADRFDERNLGWNPSSDTGTVAAMPLAKSKRWFEETKSAGNRGAWRTYFPDLENPASEDSPPWRSNERGGFEQDYFSPQQAMEGGGMNNKHADWFESSINRYDSFGRDAPPARDSPRNYVEWPTSLHNTTLRCKDPGCIANSSLEVKGKAGEQLEKCRLSIHVHPTDFDDEYSREYVELLSVNGRSMTTRCFPKAHGCNGVNGQELVPCLKDYPLEGLLGPDKKLSISGRLSPMVDECPFEGHLLNGVVRVDCLVQPPWLARRRASASPQQWGRVIQPPATNGTAMLQCKRPGCAANATIHLSKNIGPNATCKLTLTVNQTDFDGDLKQVEEIEWVKLDGNITLQHKSPGKNPCKHRNGTKILRGPYVLLNGTDVTQAAADGVIEIAAKISHMVDECGSNGFLLDAKATVLCTSPPVRVPAPGPPSAPPNASRAAKRR